jgi:hypothetical protein
VAANQLNDREEIVRDLQALEAELKRLEAEYNMFSAGRLPRPPWETRGRVEAIIKRWDRGAINAQGVMERFRFNTLQTRFQTFVDLWDRGMRAREEGRPGPFNWGQPPATVERDKPSPPRVLHVASFTDPMREMDKLHSLYDSLMDARRENGDDVVPFHRFAALVKDQVKKLSDGGSQAVAFRVSSENGKVSFTARGTKGEKD